MGRSIGGTFVLAISLAALPAGADVKAGIDAWSRGDYPAAVGEWRPLAIKGDADAQFDMGQAYRLGRGVPVDPVQAQQWFRRAADQGHRRAQDDYGIGLYQLGRKAEAAPWLERSVARGEPRAQMALGTMLFDGDGVKANHPRAYALMTRAVQAGIPSALQSLARMDDVIPAADRERGLRIAEDQVAAEDLAASRTPAPHPVGPIPSTSAPPPRTIISHAGATPHLASPAGNWRIQLGAFRDRDNAEALWARVRGRLGGAQPAYVTGGGVIRLQATGFSDRAAAQRACAAAGGACLVIAP